MTEYEKDLLIIACSKAILQLKELIYIVQIPKTSNLDFNELEQSLNDIEYCLREVGEAENE